MPSTACVVLILAVLAAPAGAAESLPNAIFLVAKREMGDPRFRETVVLVTQPGQGGPFGVIINKPLQHRLADVFPDLGTLKGRDDVVYFGGPVVPRGLFVLLRAEKMPLQAVRVLKDVFFSGDPEVIDGLLQRDEPTRGLRVYAGYSGWAPGQLQNELARGDWYVMPADAETVFEKPSTGIWPELLERASTKHANTREGGRAGERDFPSPDLAL
ncbi:MAG: hypothetical protein A3I02_05530 [Betaproteobacteria bacterium RIFCSPLOWO2_02_FULL_67_26]|nr:MAG: hypothetical protein A3I02_05530 [Betaproteobacteria bacterium RIFCSPLOWO2_02_FULL_67_26]